MPPSRVLTVDSGAGHAAWAVFTTTKAGQLTLEHFGMVGFNPDPGLEEGWSALVGQSLAPLAKAEKWSGPATVVLPGHLVLTKFIKTPSIEEAKRDKIITFEAGQNIPYPLHEVRWEHRVVEDNGVDLEVLLTAVKNEVVDKLCRAVADAGLRPTAIQPSCLTLLRAYRYTNPDETTPTLVVSIGARSTNLLYVDGGRYFARTIALAGNGVTQMIAEALKQEFMPAERLKLQVLSGAVKLPESSPARAAVTGAVATFCGRLHLEITRSTVNYRRQSGAEAPTKILLTGGGALLPELADVLQTKLKTPVERFDVLRRVQVDGKAEAAREHAAILADLVGAAVPARRDEKIVNLLPVSLGIAEDFRRRQPWYMAAAALLVVGWALPGWHYHRLAEASRGKVIAVEQAMRPLQVWQRRNEENLGNLEAAQREIAALRDLVETKSNWINFFSDLQERLVSVNDVWLEKLEVVRPATPTPDRSRTTGLFGADAEVSDDGSAPVPPPEPLRLNVTGRLLDRENPVSRVSQASYDRVKRLLASFVDSTYIAAVENERFDATTPGVLRFDFILVVNPEKPL